VVPEDHSTTPCRAAVNFSDELPATLSVESGTKGYMADQRLGRTVGLDAWAHTAKDAACAPAVSPCFRRRVGPAMYPRLCGKLLLWTNNRFVDTLSRYHLDLAVMEYIEAILAQVFYAHYG
jgi:hypothetical protein